MNLIAQLNPSDWMPIFQCSVALVALLPAFAGLIIISIQLRTHARLLKLNALAARHQLFMTLTDSVSDGAYEATMLHMSDQFVPSIFEERYRGRERRIRSYLLMKRKYLYLLFSSRVERHFSVHEANVATIWLEELRDCYELHDVHARHGVYYQGGFSTFVTAIIGETKPARWLCGEDEEQMLMQVNSEREGSD